MKTFAFRPLADDYLPLTLLITRLWTVVFAVPAFILTFFAADLPWYHATIIAVSAWLLMAVLIGSYNKAWFKRYSYALSEEALLINRGVFWRQMISLPRNRVQHIDITTGPLERRKNLSKLIVHTAGTRDASVTLHGLLSEEASELRQELIISNQGDSV